jgi:hypothetical protein
MRLKVAGYVSNTDAFAYLEATDTVVYGVLKVTGFTDTTHVTVEVLTAAYATTATTIWAEGAWSTRRGQPRTVCLHDQRLWFGGTASKAQTFWGSAIDDFQNFRLGTLDDSSVEFTLASAEQNAINWMVSGKKLCIGTTGDEHTVDAGETGTVITATAINVVTQSNTGSKYIQALRLNGLCMFVERQGRKIDEFVYNFNEDNYVTPDLTLLAEHVTRGGIVQMAFQKQPDSIVWCVTGEGKLIGMTYQRDQKVTGWHRHETDGTVESVACIYGDGEGADELWLIVNRTIDGVTKRYVERLDPNYRTTLDDEDVANWFYVDCGITATPDDLTVDGLDHLEGKTVSVLLDGKVQPDCVVDGGEITLSATGDVAQVGLSYTSTLEPLPLEMQLQDGTAQGRKFRVHACTTRVYKSAGGQILAEGANWDEICKRDTADAMDSPVSVVTGERKNAIATGHNASTQIIVRQAQPLPFTVLALIPIYEVYGE